MIQHKKSIAFILLAIYLFAGSITSELLKLPVLAEHFYDHKQSDKSIDFISFLVLHYEVEDGTDTDAEEDKKLPFKSIEYFGPASYASIISPFPVDNLLNPYLDSPHFYFTHDDGFFSSQFLAAIWQPPRNC